eukprot:543606_1
MTVNYNTFMDNNIAVDIATGSDSATISKNNFINNVISIRTDTDDINAANNWWNTVLFEQIAESILDRCDGYSTGAVTWWPYYLSAIDMSGINNLPSSNTITSLTCIGIDNYPNITDGTKMNSLYIFDTTLTVSGNPYYVINDISTLSTITFKMENGVEIIFLGNYKINIFGVINVGCYEYDTSSITSINGLSNSNNYTYIHGATGQSRIGGINIDLTNSKNAYGKFCNVLFKNLDYAVAEINGASISYQSKYYRTYDIDNCEINNVNYATKTSYCTESFATYDEENKLSDSYIHDISYGNYYGCIKIDNNIFENFITILVGPSTNPQGLMY